MKILYIRHKNCLAFAKKNVMYSRCDIEFHLIFTDFDRTDFSSSLAQLWNIILNITELLLFAIFSYFPILAFSQKKLRTFKNRAGKQQLRKSKCKQSNFYTNLLLPKVPQFFQVWFTYLK